MAGATGTTKLMIPPPAAPAAPPAIAINRDAVGILTTGGTVNGVARSALAPFPLCAVAGTAQTAIGTIPPENPPPAALAAPPAIAGNQDAAGILTAVGTVEGVAQCALTPSPSHAAAETAQTAATDPAACDGRAPPTALAAPQAIAVNQDAAGILMTGGTVEGVAQCALMPLPSRAAAETA